MDKISEFLRQAQEEYKYGLLAVEQDMERLRSQLEECNSSISEIESSIDKSYVVMSASGIANEEKTAELAALRELKKTYEEKIIENDNKKSELEKNIVNIKELIELYEVQLKMFGSISAKQLIQKLDFISKLVKVDAFRAVEELEQLKKILTGK